MLHILGLLLPLFALIGMGRLAIKRQLIDQTGLVPRIAKPRNMA
jgi:hypothetical protein